MTSPDNIISGCNIEIPIVHPNIKVVNDMQIASRFWGDSVGDSDDDQSSEAGYL